MKKVLSFFLVVAVLLLSSLSAFAAGLPITLGSDVVVGVNSGLYFKAVESSDNTILVTCSLKGTVKLTSAVFKVAFDKSVVLPWSGTDYVQSDTSRITDQTTVETVISSKSGTMFSGRDVSEPQIESRDAQANKFVSYGIARKDVSDYITESDFGVGNGSVELFTIKFKKTATAIANGTAITDATFYFSNVAASASKFALGTTTYTSATTSEPTAFTKTIVPYTPQVEDDVDVEALPDTDELDGAVDENTAITFSGTVKTIVGHTTEAGIEINGRKLPAQITDVATEGAPTGLLRGGKFAVVVKGFDSLPSGSYLIKSYQMVNDAVSYLDAGYTFIK